MRIYIVYLSTTYTPKNSVHAEIQQYARKVNRTVLHGAQSVYAFIFQFKDSVRYINEAYKRCKDLELDIQNQNAPDIRIQLSGNFTIDILAGKRIEGTANCPHPEICSGGGIVKCLHCGETLVDW